MFKLNFCVGISQKQCAKYYNNFFKFTADSNFLELDSFCTLSVFHFPFFFYFEF